MASLRRPTGKRPRRPTSETTTSAGREHQHHTARLHLHAGSTSSTSEDRETSYLHDTYGHRVYSRTWIGELPTRVSPPYSHQSQSKVERFHRNPFDHLRTTRLQWSKELSIEPHMLPQESLFWALHHSIFILNNYLVHSSRKTSHFENCRYNYRSNIVYFGEIVLGDIRNIPT